MKIPVILAQEPAGHPPSIGSVPTIGAGTAIIGEGVGRLGAALVRIGQVQQLKREQFGRDEAAAAAAAFELDVKTFDSDLRVAERDPDRYLATLGERLTKSRQQAAERLTTDEGRALFEGRVRPALVEAEVGARRHANELYVQRGTALIDDTTATTLRLIGGTPFGDDDAFRRHLRGGYDAIVGATPYLGEVETGKRRRAFGEAALEAYGNAAIEAERFDPADPRWAGMDPAKFETLRRRAETAERGRRAEEDRRARQAKEELDEDKKALIAELDRKAAEGTLRVEDVNIRAEMRQLDPEPARRLRALALEGPSGRASDATVLRLVQLDVHSTNPEMTEEALDVLQARHEGGGRGLSLKDAVPLKDRLRQQRQALKAEGQSVLRTEHYQAEQLLRAAVGMPPGLVAAALGDSPAARLYLAGLEELTRRSRLFEDAYGGKESPLAVAADIAPRLGRALGETARLKLEELRAVVPFQTADALEAARPRLGEAAYRHYQRLLLEVERLEKQRQTTPAAGEKPKERR